MPGGTRASVGEALRFFAVSAGGVVIDLAVSYALIRLFGLPIWLGTAIGFTVAATGNYAVHEYWTFQSGQSRLSARRALQYLGASTATLLARLAVVGFLSTQLGAGQTLLILILGAGASFFVNFALSKLLIFSRRPHHEDFSS